MFNIIRYPGSKAKIWSWIVRHCPPPIQFGGMWAKDLHCYCEPFVGSAAISQRVLQAICGNKSVRVILNDKDTWLAALWQSVKDAPHELIRRVEETSELAAEDFYRTKKDDGDDRLDPVEAGFRKLVLHRSSFSGLGAKAGGPLGGKSQTSAYSPSCRWSPHTIVGSILKAHRLMGKFRCLEVWSKDFEEVLAMVPPGDTSFAYLDPPYYVQGAALYKHSFEHADHVRLARVLKDAEYQFALSYDDCPEVRELYQWEGAVIQQFNMTPTVQTSKEPRRKNSELVITNY